MPSPSSRNPAPIWKIAVGWLAVVVPVVAIGAWFLFNAEKRPSTNEHGTLFAVVMFVLGVFSLIAGIASYIIVLSTHCFMFNFTRPIWNELKVRLYFANIIVPLLGMMGIGFMLSAFLTPTLKRLGLSQSVAQFAPVIGCIVLLQIVLVWFLIWSPLEKRIIRKRLLARGLTESQLDTGIYLGLSDPNKSSLKKISCVEEDIGMLWFDSQQLIYWGDNDGFALHRDNLIDVERKMDGASTSALSGTAHVILHVRQDDGSERHIRLHCEGIGTLGGKRSAMNELSDRIETWRGVTTPPPLPAG